MAVGSPQADLGTIFWNPDCWLMPADSCPCWPLGLFLTMHRARLQIPGSEMPALDLGLFTSPCCSLLQVVGVTSQERPSLPLPPPHPPPHNRFVSLPGPCLTC